MCADKLDKEGKEFNRKLFGVTGLDSRTYDITYIPCIPKQLTKENADR